MPQRHVLLTFNHLPYGSIYYTEGLRAAVGVTSGIDEHTVDLLYLGDGVHFAVKDLDRADSAKYLATLSKQGVKLKVDREALRARGLSEADVAQDVEVIDRTDALELVRRADMTIDF
ncbi:MAG: DsrE family protein [Chloroflexota bacterium]|nr:DsrE family protein [Chloroflexota bacterium]